jgi:hypothetical protein
VRTTFRTLETLAAKLTEITQRPFTILQSSPQSNGTRKYALMEAHRYSDLVPSPYYLKAGALADILRNEIAVRLDQSAEERGYGMEAMTENQARSIARRIVSQSEGV